MKGPGGLSPEPRDGLCLVRSVLGLQEDEAVLAGVSDDYLEDDGEQRVRVLAATALRVGERRVLLKTDYVSRTWPTLTCQASAFWCPGCHDCVCREPVASL